MHTGLFMSWTQSEQELATPPPPHKILSQSAARKVFGNLARAPVCASGAHHEASVESDPDWCGSNFERYLVNGDTLT